MLASPTPCESPSRNVWHLVSGVLSLALLWAAIVIAVGFLAR